MTTIAVVADLHTNCTVGLCPPVVQLDDGGTYHASKAQQAIYDDWGQYWQEAKRRKRGKLYAVIDGDLCDLNRHDGVGLITHNRADIVRMALTVLEPVADVSDRIFIIRGTEAHVGEHAYLEELIAREIGATPDEEAGTFTWWWLPLDTDGLLIDIAHHPETGGNMPQTEDAAVGRNSFIIRARCLEHGLRVPDIAIRAHKHQINDSGAKTKKPLVLWTPSWQLTTNYGYRLGAGGIVRPLGGWFIDCENGTYQHECMKFVMGSKKSWSESTDAPKETLLSRFASLWASKTSQTTREP